MHMANYTNSPLVSYVALSPNKTTIRTHAIDTITIHCTAGQMSVESLGTHFANKAVMASSNYGIGKDGRIAMFVPESSRSWCSSNPENDHRAITIEVSSDDKSPYAVYSEAYDSLITLVADVCRRNGITQLRWKHDKSLVGKTDAEGKLLQNLTLHKWVANKACPREFLEGHMSEIAEKVNALLQH